MTHSPTARQAQLLRFITCGSVDDGKSTLIGRLLLDSRAVLGDQLADVQRHGQTDLALLTDGLSAEREQGITIDVAYRYFSTRTRKFIIGDAPGHEQYTRNMVTAASSADAAVVLVDATKLDWADPALALLPQTRRHALLAHLLNVPSVVFVVNKLDAVLEPVRAFAHIRGALLAFARAAGLQARQVVPVSALLGWNVVDGPAEPGWAGYQGPGLLPVLEQLPVREEDASGAMALAVQWVERSHGATDDGRADAAHGRRIYWGRVARGEVRVGQVLSVLPGGQHATVVRLLDHVRRTRESIAGHDAGLVLDRELDISRGDWLLGVETDPPAARPATEAHPPTQSARATLAWLDNEQLQPGRVYWGLHGHRWVKTRVTRILDRLDIATLQPQSAEQLEANAIATVELSFQESLPLASYRDSRALGAMVLVDTRSHNTCAAVMVH